MAYIFPKAIIDWVNLVVLRSPRWAVESTMFFFSFFSLLLTELEYLWGVGAVMVRDTASSAGDEENVVFCPLFVR